MEMRLSVLISPVEFHTYNISEISCFLPGNNKALFLENSTPLCPHSATSRPTLHRFLPHPLHTPLRSTQFSARSAPFSTARTCSALVLNSKCLYSPHGMGFLATGKLSFRMIVSILTYLIQFLRFGALSIVRFRVRVSSRFKVSVSFISLHFFLSHVG